MNDKDRMKNVAPGVPAPYYSQCDSKGRCIRHPTVQLSRKKKLGGWKTIQSICPMCAMEMIAKEVPTTAPAADVDVRGRRGREQQPLSSSRKKYDGDRDDCAVSLHSHNGGSRRNGGGPPPDDNKSVHSAPSAYPRHPRPPLVSSKRSTGELSVSSSDSTADMSYSSSSDYSRGGGRGYYHHRRNSSGSDDGSHRSGGSWRSHGSSSHRSARSQQGSLHSAHGSAARRPVPQGPYIGHVANSKDETNHAIDADQEEFVCGMKFSSRGCYYTGQIHARTRLPHGLGSLRDDADGSVVEGKWHYGRLVRESRSHHAAPSPPPPAHRQEYDSNNDRGKYEGDNGLYDRFSQHAVIHDVQEGYETEDGSASSVSNSIAETLDNDFDASQSSAEWSRASITSQGSAYSARESKGSLPPPPNCSNDVTSDKLREYERYVERCDDDGDYYYRDGGSGHAGETPPPQDCDRQRKVRFREDP